MKIIITQSFEDQFDKYIGKEKISLDVFCDRIGYDLLKETRYLHRPYLKIKVTLKSKAMRIVAICYEIEGIIVPVYITDKNDKTYGENMTRDTIKKIIDIRVPIIQQELIDHIYKEFVVDV